MLYLLMPYKDPIKQSKAASKNRRKAVLANKERIKQLKESTPCVDCQVQYPYYVMDFDHIKSASKRGRRSFADFVNRGWSWERLLTEISKCDIVCSNCHRIRTQKRLGG